MTLPLNSEYCVDLLYTDYNSDYSIVDTTGIMNRLDAAKAESPDIIVAMLHWALSMTRPSAVPRRTSQICC